MRGTVMGLLPFLSLCAAAPVNPPLHKLDIVDEDSVAEEKVGVGLEVHYHETITSDQNANRKGKFEFSFKDVGGDIKFGTMITNNQVSIPTDGGWSGWSDFGPCSATCGAATKKRERTCHGGDQCPGSNEDIANCTLSDCAIDGEWTSFGPCTKTCEGGLRTRTCTNPIPQNGGKQCIGEASQSCNDGVECMPAIDGEWTSFGACTKTCEGGWRTRTCTNPIPQNGGKQCIGEAFQSCNDGVECTLGMSQQESLDVKINNLNDKINKIDDNLKAIGELSTALQNIMDGLKALSSGREKRSGMLRFETKLLELVDEVTNLVKKCENGDSCDSNKIKNITKQITSTFKKVVETGTVTSTFKNSLYKKKGNLDTSILAAKKTQGKEKAKVLTALSIAVPQGCLLEDGVGYGVGYLSDNLPGYPKASSGEYECAKLCSKTEKCKVWVINKPDNRCWLKTDKSHREVNGRYISGPPGCWSGSLVLELDALNFDRVVKSDSCVLVMFYVPCNTLFSHYNDVWCRQIFSEYNTAAKMIADKPIGSYTKMAKIDISVHRAFNRPYNILGHLTYKLFFNGLEFDQNNSKRILSANEIVNWLSSKCLGGLRCKGIDNGCCTKESPCEENDGDCDNSDQCEGDLVCGTDNCAWGDADDCCMKDPSMDIREPETNGYCLTSGGQDQNDGTQKLNSGGKSDCYHQCKAIPQASGCEWHTGGTCICHTLDVATGNGNSDYTCWVFNYSPKDFKERLRELFQSIDDNHDGIIDVEEVLRVCQENYIQITEAEAKSILTLPDKSVGLTMVVFTELLELSPSSNTADLVHFLLLAAAGTLEHGEFENNLKYFFLALDTDHDCKLLFPDLITVFRDLGSNIPLNDAKSLLSVDTIGKGLDFNLWKKMVLQEVFKTKHLIHYWREAFAGVKKGFYDVGGIMSTSIQNVAETAAATLALDSQVSECYDVGLVKVETSLVKIVQGLEYTLGLRLDTRAGGNCRDNIVKVCENIAVLKPLPENCLGVASLKLINQDRITCRNICPADEVSSDDCLCENGISGAKQSCSSNQGCTNNGICLDGGR